MLLRAAIAAALLVSASCTKSEGGDSAGSLVASAPGSAARAGSGSGSGSGSSSGGFSADLARELGGGAPKVDGGGGSDAAKAGSGAAKADPPKAGSDAPRAGSNAVAAAGNGTKVEPAANAGSDAPRAGSNAVAAAGNGTKVEPAAKAGSGVLKAGSVAVAAVAAGSGTNVEPAPNAGSAAAISPPPDIPKTTGSPSAPPSQGPVKVPGDLAAIKISLLPNWDRDIGRAGTFQYVVRIKGTQSTKTFTFHYGYDDPKAPAAPDQYKKYLQDAKVMVGEIRDRQRGSAWFLEGNDAAGLPAFRYVILYGGKHLICYGSLYKDADSNRLGDDRDQTVIQAKQICETLAL